MRRRSSTAGEVSHILINYSGPSFSYLPRDILENILLRLSVKRIFICKGVCRTWNNLISNPEFAKIHHEQAEVYPLIRTSDLPGNLYLVQPEKDDFELKLDMSHHIRSNSECVLKLDMDEHALSNSECVCHVEVELHTTFELPKCNRMIHYDEDSKRNMLDHDNGEERNKFMKPDMKDDRYSIVNSCNGLLCLSDPSDNYPLIICNPITGEFMKLPEAKKVKDLGLEHSSGFVHGFGFSPATNQYKVIRMCEGVKEQDIGPMKVTGRGSAFEVHTLGTELWRSIGFFFTLTCTEVPPIYLNGFLYWFSDLHPIAIVSFDIEKECLKKVAKPPVKSMHGYDFSMGVLGDELCMTGIDEKRWRSVIVFSIWVLKNCGDEQEWSKVLTIKLNSNIRTHGGPYQPITYLNDGALLMFQRYNNALIYKDPRKLGFRYLKVCGMQSTLFKPKMEVIAHIPSFVPLKHALSLSGQNVKVLNVKSRCAGLGKAISIVEKAVKGEREHWGSFESDSDSDNEDKVLGSNSDDR